MTPELFGGIAVGGGFGHCYGNRRVEGASTGKENETVSESDLDD
jgi:hypothetical protein